MHFKVLLEVLEMNLQSGNNKNKIENMKTWGHIP
jgi:hypothetical protein